MKFVSTSELNHIKELLINDEIDLAISELRKLCKKYPNDSTVYQELGSVLLRQGIHVSEALYYLSLATNSRNKHSISYDIGVYYLSQGDFRKAEEKFKTLLDGNESYRCYGYLGLIRTYIHTEEYKKALDCFDELKKLRRLTDFDVSHYYNLKFYLLYKNNIIIDESRADNYFTKQLLNYSKESAIEHIKEHLKEASDEELKSKRFHSVFDKETNIEELYDFCSETIKKQKPVGYGIVDYYICELNDKVGATYSKKETASVEIITFPNSKQILSIYPVYDKHINKVSNIKEEEKKPKPKKKKKLTKKNHK